MLNESLTDLKSRLDQDGIVLTFTGPFSQEIIEVLGDSIKKHIKSDENIKKNTLNVFSVFIEQTQNINAYLSSKKFAHEGLGFLSSGLIIIGKTSENYFVYSGNMVIKEDAIALMSMIEEINGLDKEQLKAAYKSQMKRERSIPEGVPGGAGLGLLEMARKSSAPIEYTLVNRDERFDYIILKVIV